LNIFEKKTNSISVKVSEYSKQPLKKEKGLVNPKLAIQLNLERFTDYKKSDQMNHRKNSETVQDGEYRDLSDVLLKTSI